jgi:hypothetical protein
MDQNSVGHFQAVVRQLETFGLLLESDPKLPNVCTVITGERMKGSWWSHRLAQTIFQVNEQLEDHPDLLITKLLAGKVTFVHRQLWSELFVVAAAREEWQTKGLSESAHALLKKVSDDGIVRTDQIERGTLTTKITEAARELERRLLVHSDQVHTESGAHAKVLETWESWARRKEFSPAPITVTQAKATLEKRVQMLNEEFGAKVKLPWKETTA